MRCHQCQHQRNAVQRSPRTVSRVYPMAPHARRKHISNASNEGTSTKSVAIAIDVKPSQISPCALRSHLCTAAPAGGPPSRPSPHQQVEAATMPRQPLTRSRTEAATATSAPPGCASPATLLRPLGRLRDGARAGDRQRWGASSARASPRRSDAGELKPC